jgi:hypothetical protein
MTHLTEKPRQPKVREAPAAAEFGDIFRLASTK